MKKVILFESSALAALQSVAQRNNNDADSDSLIFSLSPWIHNQGSHSSHCSHASRYSSIIGQPSLPTKPRLDDTIAFITEIDSTEVIELSKSQTAFACEHIAKDWKIPENELKMRKTIYAYVKSIINGNNKNSFLHRKCAFLLNGRIRIFGQTGM